MKQIYCLACAKKLPEFRVAQGVPFCNAECQSDYRNGKKSDAPPPEPKQHRGGRPRKSSTYSQRVRFEQTDLERVQAEAKVHPRSRTTTHPEGAGNTRGAVYVVYSPRLNLYKLGKSKNVAARIGTIRVNIMDKHAHVVFYLVAKNMSKAEGYLHFKYSHRRVEGEWFDLQKTDIEEIRSMGKTYTPK